MRKWLIIFKDGSHKIYENLDIYKILNNLDINSVVDVIEITDLIKSN